MLGIYSEYSPFLTMGSVFFRKLNLFDTLKKCTDKGLSEASQSTDFTFLKKILQKYPNHYF